MGYVTKSGAPGKMDAEQVANSARSGTDGFKKGGKVEKGYGGKAGCMKKGGKVMSKAAKPARATGGGVFSSAHSGTPRGATPKPY